jgi:hypothetical protein
VVWEKFCTGCSLLIDRERFTSSLPGRRLHSLATRVSASVSDGVGKVKEKVLPISRPTPIVGDVVCGEIGSTLVNSKVPWIPDG